MCTVTFESNHSKHAAFLRNTNTCCRTWNWIIKERGFFFFAATRESVLLKLIVWVFSLLRISCFAGFLYVATQTFHSEATYFCGEFKNCVATQWRTHHFMCLARLLWIFWGGRDVKARAKPWTQKLKIHFDKHISLGQIKTESNKPSVLGVRARPFWTSSGGSRNKTDTLTPLNLSPFWCPSPHCWHGKPDTRTHMKGV